MIGELNAGTPIFASNSSTYCSVCVQGQVRGKEATENWYAMVVGFVLKGKNPMKAGVAQVVKSRAKVKVLWFYDAESVSGFLSNAPKSSELAMVKAALQQDHYLLGVEPQLIGVDTISGEWPPDAPSGLFIGFSSHCGCAGHILFLYGDP